jgi:ribosome-binding protein aMBF1 (putative translation factor)
MKEMTMYEALVHLVNDKGMSRYYIAKRMQVQPIMVRHWLNGTRPRQETADRFAELFDIKVTNIYKAKI